MQFVVIAGGKGTRSKSSIPKILFQFESKPLLNFQLDCIKNFKTEDFKVSFLLGYESDRVASALDLQNNLQAFTIEYFDEKIQKGPGGALIQNFAILEDEFILILGDLFFDFDFDKFILYARTLEAEFVAVVHPNGHSFDSDTIQIDIENLQITKINFKSDVEKDYSALASAGIYYCRKNLLTDILEQKNNSYIEILKDIIGPKLSFTSKFFAYNTFEYIHDTGTPKRRELVARDLKTGVPSQRSSSFPKPALFLDRDSTIMPDPYTFNFVPTLEFARALFEVDRICMPVFVISNQPRIAKGATFAEVRAENNDFESKLEWLGAKIDGWYFCPHHPDKGFPGERIEYKVRCLCRKPGKALFEYAAEEHRLNIQESILIGDSIADFEASKKLGMNFIHTFEFKACQFSFDHVCFGTTAEAILTAIGKS